jgi:diguanylate cyclase (GGDEF)-like protein
LRTGRVGSGKALARRRFPKRATDGRVDSGWWAAWRVYLFVGLFLTGAYFLLSSGVVRDTSFVLIGLLAVAAVVAGIVLNRPVRPLPWWLMALGLSMSVAGDTTVAVYQHVLKVAQYPFPSVSDALYLAAYPLMAAGLLLMRSQGIARDRAGLIDPLIVATGAGVIYWTFLLSPVADAHGLSLPQRLVNVAYPVTDVLLFVVMARFLLLRSGPRRHSPACHLIMAALALLLVSDLTSDALALSGVYEVVAGFYEPAALVSAGWLASYALFGAASLHPSMASLSEPGSQPEAKLTWGRLVLLTGTTLLAPGVLAVQTALGRPMEAPVIVGASVALFLLVASRMAGMIGQRQALERRLEYQAFHDFLTDLPNRALFADRLEHALARAGRRGDSGGSVAVLLVDLDDFKRVNDSLGHGVGDAVLTAVGERLRGCLRPTDTAARLGGDEFAALLQGADEEEATRVAQRISAALRAPTAIEGQRVAVGASVGVALSGAFCDSPGDLLRKADLALYRAKGKGKGSYVVATPGLQVRIAQA